MDNIQPVTISYYDLVSSSNSLPALVQEAFDSKPESLGLLLVKDLPEEFKELRRRLLLLVRFFSPFLRRSGRFRPCLVLTCLLRAVE